VFLRQHRSAMAEQAVMAGHNAAMSRVLACSTAEGAVQEQAGGITFLRSLTALEQDFPARSPALRRPPRRTRRMIFHLKISPSLTVRMPTSMRARSH